MAGRAISVRNAPEIAKKRAALAESMIIDAG